MTLHGFKYYLHDSYNSFESLDWIARQTGLEIDDELADKIGRPFYEVGLNCTLDDETGRVTIVSADT